MSEDVFGPQVANLTIAEAKIDSFSSSPFNTMPNGSEITIKDCSVRSTRSVFNYLNRWTSILIVRIRTRRMLKEDGTLTKFTIVRLL